MLTLISRAKNANADARNKGNARDRVRCHCGHEFVVRTSHRKSGKVTACKRCTETTFVDVAICSRCGG